MTKVYLSQSVLDYCEEMAELVREVSAKPTISGVEPRSGRELFPVRKEPPAFRLDGLLKPPRVEELTPCLFPAEDQIDGIIQVITSGEYGVVSVYVTLEDDQGKQIERGLALRDKVDQDDWYYFPSASFRSGASVTVRAIAMDPLGGIGSLDQNLTV